MRLYFLLLFSVLSLSIHARVLNNEQPVVSETRQQYLDKAVNLEYQLNSIDIKWNWIAARPGEDSIAIAQGWYVQMEARRTQLKSDLMLAKMEQIQNYYQDIIDLYSADAETQKAKIKTMETNRQMLAPDYPQLDEYIPSSQSSLDLLKVWIEQYPAQYAEFTNYLENLVIG